RLQEDLIAVGCFSEVADGSFGQSTVDAVMLFQEAVGLVASGIVDEATWSVLEGPEASEERSIDISDLPGLTLAASHASDESADAYLADLGVE
ncbi:peptidoglycan-binding protein, partial [bacterium M00.F.Ca.ET.168.01.1.1]